MERLTKRLGDGKAVMDCSSCELQEKTVRHWDVGIG